MTKEEIDVLERWIESIIEDKDRASDLHEAIRRSACKEEVIQTFCKGKLL